MNQLPLAARAYMGLIWGIAAVASLLLLPTASVLAGAPLLSCVGLIGYALAYYADVSFEARPGHRISWTVDEAVCIFLITVFGPPGAWLTALSILIVATLKRRPFYRALFNAAMLYLAYLLAAFVYQALQPPGRIPFSGANGLLTFLSVAGSYYLSNMLLISTMIALATRRPILQVYRENLYQVNWVQMLVFTIGAGLAALYAVDPWLLIYGILTLVIARRAFATVADLNAETRRRETLAEERAALYEEQARLSSELAQQQVELAQASKLAALGTFSAGIAHEFNNVLTAVLGHAQLGQFSAEREEKDYSLNVIARVCQRATSITASLLTFARQRAPELSLGRLQSAITDTVDLIRPDLEKESITLVQQIEDLPAMLCDLGQINQVLLNLITNARDALREHRVGGEIRLSLTRADDQALISIADNGPGMSPEVLDKIFQPFVTTKKKGNGLGMAICYGIVEGHKGKIEVASEVGNGTVVTIRLPIRTEAPTAAPEEDADMPLATAA